MNDELKQQGEGLCCCPFCGNPNSSGIDFDSILFSREGAVLYIKCPDCGVVLRATKEQYNNRPLEDALRAKLDEAMEVLALIRTNLPPLWVRELIDEYLQKLREV